MLGYRILEILLTVLSCLITYIITSCFSKKQIKEISNEFKIYKVYVDQRLEEKNRISKKENDIVEIKAMQEDIQKKQLFEDNIKNNSLKIPAKLEKEISKISDVPFQEDYFEFEGIVNSIDIDSKFRVQIPSYQSNDKLYYKGDYINITIDEQSRFEEEKKKGVIIVFDILNRTYELLDEELEEKLFTGKTHVESSKISNLKIKINDKVVVRIYRHLPFSGVIVKKQKEPLIIRR